MQTISTLNNFHKIDDDNTPTYHRYTHDRQNDRLMLSELTPSLDELNARLAQAPQDVDTLCELAKHHAALDQTSLALSYCEQALALAPTHTACLCQYAELMLTGPNYLQAIQDFHAELKPKRYIEIGVCRGGSFRLVSPDTFAIGIDPQPQLDQSQLPEQHLVMTATSDDYFASHLADEHFQAAPFDLAFIDGMHWFEYALRDFINLERYSHPDSVVLIHDVYPINEITARRERVADFWSGDVWKVILCLQAYRPDLSISILPCPPTGLGVIRGLNAENQVLADQLPEIIKQFMGLRLDAHTYDQIKQLTQSAMPSIS